MCNTPTRTTGVPSEICRVPDCAELSSLDLPPTMILSVVDVCSHVTTTDAAPMRPTRIEWSVGLNLFRYPTGLILKIKQLHIVRQVFLRNSGIVFVLVNGDVLRRLTMPRQRNWTGGD